MRIDAGQTRLIRWFTVVDFNDARTSRKGLCHGQSGDDFESQPSVGVVHTLSTLILMRVL